MKYLEEGQFGLRCDALTRSGVRCHHRNNVLVHCAIGGETDPIPTFVWGRPVRLCRQHSNKHYRLVKQGKRLALREGGFLGPWNEHSFGNMVTEEEHIDWATAKVIHIPTFWRSETDPTRDPEATSTDPENER